MGIAPNQERYLVVGYEVCTDLQSIGYLAEYMNRMDAERDVRRKVSAGLNPEKIRVFKAKECSISVTMEVNING